MDFLGALGYPPLSHGAPLRFHMSLNLRPIRALAAAAMLALLGGPAQAQGFKFSQPDESDRLEEQARQARIAENLSTPCRANIKDKKIMVVIGEQQSNGYIFAQQQNFGPHFQAINVRLRSLGLKTYTPEQIRQQIAQAEIEAYFRNDPDAALAASKKLGASFVLRGLITAQSSANLIMAVNQVSVNMDFTLYGGNGRVVADAHANSSSYAGADVQRMALTLINEKADEVVSQLYADYCRNAGMGAGGKPSAK
jgi:hypothetical protein